MLKKGRDLRIFSPWLESTGRKTGWLYLTVLFFLSACTPIQPIDPDTVQVMAQSAWEQAWHGTWELTWREAPLPGSIIFEGWRTEGGGQQRLEILEAQVPSLIGLAYINDGQTARYFNRLEPAIPTTSGDATLPFSPLTDVFDTVTKLLDGSPQSARQRPLTLPQGPGLELTLTYPQTQTLTLWLDTTNNLIIKADLDAPATHLSLIARTLELLVNPHPNLFK
jgi:hypothetical protein